MIISGNLFKISYYFAYSLQNTLKILFSNPYHYLNVVCPGFCFKKNWDPQVLCQPKIIFWQDLKQNAFLTCLCTHYLRQGFWPIQLPYIKFTEYNGENRNTYDRQVMLSATHSLNLHYQGWHSRKQWKHLLSGAWHTRPDQEVSGVHFSVTLCHTVCVLCQLTASRVGVDQLQPCQQPADIINTQYTNCCTYSASWWWANKYSKHVEATNRNKLKTNSVSSSSYYTDISRCTVNKTWTRMVLFTFFK
jgi:hypothetical protein